MNVDQLFMERYGQSPSEIGAGELYKSLTDAQNGGGGYQRSQDWSSVGKLIASKMKGKPEQAPDEGEMAGSANVKTGEVT